MSSMKFVGAVLLAHQGGWDEIALVGGPIILIIGVLAIAKRRVESEAANQRSPADSARADVDSTDSP